MRTVRSALHIAVVLLISSAVLAQTPEDRVRQSLQAHLGTKALPDDLTIQGQVIDRSGTRPVRIQIKGKTRARYELGVGATAIVSIFNGRSGWAGSSTNLKPLPDHASTHRAGHIPFLDVVSEIGDTRLRAVDLGTERVGQAALRRVSLRFRDPAPQGRFLNRPLHEDVELFIDPATNLIVRSRRMLTADNSMDFKVPLVYDFSDYRVVEGLAIPFRIASTVGTPSSGVHESTWVIYSVLVNQGIADTVFEPR